MRSLNEIRDELAEKRSMRQCSTGHDDLNRVISWYLRIGFEEGFDACAKALLEMSPEFDEDAAKNGAKEELISYHSETFIVAARWMFDQCKMQIAALKDELEKTKKAIRDIGEGRPSEWAYTQLLNDYKKEREINRELTKAARSGPDQNPEK